MRTGEFTIMRDMPNPAELAWRAHIGHPELGVVSAADSTAWRAIARTLACFVLRQHGLDGPLQAQEPLDHTLARAEAASLVAGTEKELLHEGARHRSRVCLDRPGRGGG